MRWPISMRTPPTRNPFYLSVSLHRPARPLDRPILRTSSTPTDDCAFESCPQEELHPWAKVPKGSPFAASSGLSDNMGNRESPQGLLRRGHRSRSGTWEGSWTSSRTRGCGGDTLVVFTSDNGYSCGHHGFWGKGNGTAPVNMYENSIKVPFPGHAYGGDPGGDRPSRPMVSEHDFMPTLLDYVGLPLPDTNLAGTSFLAALKDEQAGRARAGLRIRRVRLLPDDPHRTVEVRAPLLRSSQRAVGTWSTTPTSAPT